MTKDGESSYEVGRFTFTRPFPEGAEAREQARADLLEYRLNITRATYMSTYISMRCEAAINYNISPHTCRNIGDGCLCACHDLTVRHDEHPPELT